MKVRNKGATVGFYSCKSGSSDYFVSLDAACDDHQVLGINGYGYGKPVAGLNLVALYRCNTSTDDFVSNDASCESRATGRLLGYALP